MIMKTFRHPKCSVFKSHKKLPVLYKTRLCQLETEDDCKQLFSIYFTMFI